MQRTCKYPEMPPRLLGLVLLALALSPVFPLGAGACVFTNQCYSCASSPLYGRLPNQGARLGPGVTDNDVAFPGLVFNGWLYGTNRITLFWGRGWQDANTSIEGDVIRTFARPAAQEDDPVGRYEPTEPRLSTFDIHAEYLAADHLLLYFNGCKVERSGTNVAYYGSDGQLLQAGTLGSNGGRGSRGSGSGRNKYQMPIEMGGTAKGQFWMTRLESQRGRLGSGF